MKESEIKVDTKELDLPQTVYSRDIETKVIQIIILQSLSKIVSVACLEKGLIDSLFGREVERVKGIFVEQDTKNHLVNVKLEINIEYGVSIPEKSQEVQEKVVEEVTRLTGLHVASVHVIVKGIVLPKPEKEKEKEEQVYPNSLLIDKESEKETNETL